MKFRNYNLIKSAYINKYAEPSLLDYYRAYQQLGDHLALGTNPVGGITQITFHNPQGSTFEATLDAALKSDKGLPPTVSVKNAPHTWASRGRQVGAIGMHGLGLVGGGAAGYGLANAATKGLGMQDSDSGFVRGLGTALNIGGLAAGAYLGHGLGRYASGRLMSGVSKDTLRKTLPKLGGKPKYDTLNSRIFSEDMDFARLGNKIQRW